MRKVISVLLIAALVICMTACGKSAGTKEDGVIYLDDPTDENVKKIEPIKKTEQNDPDISPADEEGVLDEEGESVPDSEPKTDPEPAGSTRVKIYLPDDNGKKFITYSTEVSKLDAAHIVSAMKSTGILGGDVSAVSLSSVDDGGKTLLKLDMNSAFGKQVNACGKSSAYMLMGSVVNTFLNAFDGDKITVTAGNMEISGYSGSLTAFGSNPNPPDETSEETASEGSGESSDKPKDDNAVVATALSLEGSPFENGAAGPSSFDNSGFVYYCFKTNGISLPRKTSSMFSAGTAVDKDALQKGDVVFFDLDGKGTPTYVAIYIGGGKAITESAGSNAAKVISLSTNYYAERYFGARRYE